MKSVLIGFFLIAFIRITNAQDDLLSELTNEPVDGTVIGTFKGTRVINGQSVETKPRGTLEFIFSHRFGRINEGAHTFWGLDDAYVRLGLEYGITDKFGVGIGRTSVDKTIDSYMRYKIVSQSNGPKTSPITITALASLNYRTSPKESLSSTPISANDRIAYVVQLLLARKFNSNLSLQINPLFVHRNSVDQTFENNDDFALGFAGRYKITRSLALTGEYIYRINAKENILPDYERYDSVGFGLDIDTGGHVFQLVFTNSLGLIERAIVTETNGDFWAGDIHFGFNITRTFQLSKKR